MRIEILPTFGAFLLSISVAVQSALANPAFETERIPLPEEIMRLRDPFKQPALEQEEPKSPLELHPLSSMKLVGVLTGPLRKRAMILTPDGQTHFVSESQRIGEKKGIIQKITEDRILVRERITNILGQTETVETRMNLISDNEPGAPSNEDQAIQARPFLQEQNPGVPRNMGKRR